MPTSATTPKKPSKKAMKAKQLLVTLSVQPDNLRSLLQRIDPDPSIKAKSTSTSDSPSPPSSDLAKLRTSSPGQTASEPTSTPAPPDSVSAEGGPQEQDSPTKTGSPGLKPSLKRSLTGETDTEVKLKGRPGPKKKPRLEDGSIDHGSNPPIPRIGKGTGASKLGPKASLGAINAGLRALDRSGAPCKRWGKKGLHLKSFTGVTWELPAWRAPKSAPAQALTENTTASSIDSEGKEPKAGSIAVSDRSNADDNSSNPPESSPMRPPISVT